MIEQIAQNDIRHFGNRAPPFGAVVSGAGAPAVRSVYMDLSGDVAVSHPTPWHDGYGIQVVVDTVKVPVHLRVRRVISPSEPLNA